MERTVEYEFNGFKAIVVLPEKPNGKWIWKTEFFYAFDQAERALLSEGYTRVYYGVSDMYGSYRAVRLMHAFHKDVVKRFGLESKAVLFGFSRGGLYAFNYALFYPECVSKLYLDAPVLDLKTWPTAQFAPREYEEMLREYCLDEETLKTFKGNPIDNLAEFFAHGLPLLVVAGGADEVVSFEENSKKLIDYAVAHGENVKYTIKPTCGHHPHSLEDVSSIVDFVRE